MLRYDSVYGRFEKVVGTSEEDLVIDEQRIRVFHEKGPAALPLERASVARVADGYFASALMARTEERTTSPVVRLLH